MCIWPATARLSGLVASGSICSTTSSVFQACGLVGKTHRLPNLQRTSRSANQLKRRDQLGVESKRLTVLCNRRFKCAGIHSHPDSNQDIGFACLPLWNRLFHSVWGHLRQWTSWETGRFCFQLFICSFTPLHSNLLMNESSKAVSSLYGPPV